MRSRNPILGRADAYGYAEAYAGRMSMDAVVGRTAACLGLLVAFAAVGWAAIPFENFGSAVVCGVAAMVLGLVISFQRLANPVLVLTYAGLEGLFVGAVSHAFDVAYPGVVLQAVIGTFGVFAGTLAMYQMRIIKVTDRYARMGMAVAFGFMVLVLANLLFSLFGAGNGLGLYSGNTGIVFGALGVLLGAFFLSLDFKAVEDGVRYGAPAAASWTAAFGLTLSLVWIYLQLLRLMAIIAGNRR